MSFGINLYICVTGLEPSISFMGGGLSNEEAEWPQPLASDIKHAFNKNNCSYSKRAQDMIGYILMVSSVNMAHASLKANRGPLKTCLLFYLHVSNQSQSHCSERLGSVVRYCPTSSKVPSKL